MTLPEGYEPYRQVRLDQDKRAVTILTVIQVALAAAMIFIGVKICPLDAAFDMEGGRIAVGLAATLIGSFVYILGHEWVHGVFIRIFTGKPATFGWKAGMAYAGSEAYFGRFAYVVIALAPVVIWSGIFTVLLVDISRRWFWYLYMVQIFNVMGASGDFYVTFLTMRAPRETVISDNGVEMEFYCKPH